MSQRNIWDEIVINEHLHPFDLLRSMLNIASCWLTASKISQIFAIGNGAITKLILLILTVSIFIAWFPARYLTFICALFMRLFFMPHLFGQNLRLILVGFTPFCGFIMYYMNANNISPSDMLDAIKQISL